MTKQSEIAEYRAALATNPAWAHRALVVLHDRQTRDEQETRTTETHNGVGFTGIDAEILSSFAEQVKRGRTLSVKQLAIAHRRLPKYAAQLWRIAQEKTQAAPEVSARAQEEASFRAETDAWLAAPDEEWEERVRGALSDEQMYPRDTEVDEFGVEAW